jgi:hypothetical protein
MYVTYEDIPVCSWYLGLRLIFGWYEVRYVPDIEIDKNSAVVTVDHSSGVM